MQKEAGMDKKEVQSSEEAAEISGDALAIADAIFAGLTEIAGAIRELSRSINNEEQEAPAEKETYLDGGALR